MAPRKLPKTLTGEEVRTLLARPNLDCPTGVRNRAMLELMVHAGLRVGEVVGLALRDWRTSEHTLHLRSEVAKGGREAHLPLTPGVENHLARWKQERRRHAAGRSHLFTTLAGNPVGPKYVWEMVSRYARRAGIEQHVHPHALRHTYASDLLGDGFTIREVQALMRHADLKTTAVYLHVRDADLAAKVRARGR